MPISKQIIDTRYIRYKVVPPPVLSWFHKDGYLEVLGGSVEMKSVSLVGFSLSLYLLLDSCHSTHCSWANLGGWQHPRLIYRQRAWMGAGFFVASTGVHLSCSTQTSFPRLAVLVSRLATEAVWDLKCGMWVGTSLFFSWHVLEVFIQKHFITPLSIDISTINPNY